MNGLTEKAWVNIFTFRLHRIMKKRAISQKQLSYLIDVSEATVCRYCRGERVPNAYTIAKIADVLNCAVDELVSLDSTEDEFELAGFRSEERDKLREICDKYNLDRKLLIDTVRYMGPGMGKYKSLEQLFELCKNA